MDFQDMLAYLQGLLSNRQTTQAQQWQQGLGFSQSQLAAMTQQQQQALAEQVAARQAQDALNQARLTEQSTEFGRTLEEQTAARLAAQQLAQEQQRQAEQAQRFGQQTTTRQLNDAENAARFARAYADTGGMDILRSLGFLGSINSPVNQRADLNYQDLLGQVPYNQGVLSLGLKQKSPYVASKTMM